MEKLRAHAGDADPRRLNGQDLGDGAVPEQTQKLLPNLIKQLHVHLMVQKAVHFEHAALPNPAVLPDAILHELHIRVSLFLYYRPHRKNLLSFYRKHTRHFN